MLLVVGITKNCVVLKLVSSYAFYELLSFRVNYITTFIYVLCLFCVSFFS